jgi:hypothetical protein
MKKRGLLVLLSILLLIIATGCGKDDTSYQQTPSVPLSSEEKSTFRHSLPNIRDAITSTFGSLNIYFDECIKTCDATKTMISPNPTVIVSINEKAQNARTTLSNIDLIVTDFNKKKAGTSLSGSDARLADEISSKLTSYTTNKAKLTSCVANMEKYANFIELTVEREDLIKEFTSSMEKASIAVDKENFDTAITNGRNGKQDLQRIKAIDLQRSKMGIVDISSDVLKSWDLHLEAMDILLALWNDLKLNNMNAAMEKAQKHYDTFNLANKYGEKEPLIQEQAATANLWLNSNVGVCKGLV